MKMRKSIAFLSALLVAVFLCGSVFVPSSAAAATVSFTELDDYLIRDSGKTTPTVTSDGIQVTTSALKMLALDEPIQYEEKTFTDLYHADCYQTYGNAYTSRNYGFHFDEENKTITTAAIQSKAKLNDTESMTDLTAGFTITKIGSNALYGGVIFRAQDSDFRTSTLNANNQVQSFGSQGYLLYVYSKADSTNVSVYLRSYSTASAYFQRSATAAELLGAATNGVRVALTVAGETATVTIADAQNTESAYTTSFSLRPANNTGTYYSCGSFGWVTNGNHTFTDVSLTGTVATNYVEHTKPLYDLFTQTSYTVQSSGDAPTFTNEKITTAAGTLSKIKINQHSNIEDFNAAVTIGKENGGGLYGGIGFRLQDCGYSAANFGGPGYLLFAKSESGSYDVSLILRNYLTANSYEETTIANIEGFLAAPDQKKVRMVLQVRGMNAEVTVYDAADLSRSYFAAFSLLGTSAKAGNYGGGSLAFISNAMHSYSEIAVEEIVTEAPYTFLENFSASATFRMNACTNSTQFGIMFYTQKTENRSPGLSAFYLKGFLSSSGDDTGLALQLGRYGTNTSGAENVNLGGLSGSTQTNSTLLSSGTGQDDLIRLNVRVIRGAITYSAENLTTGKTMGDYTSSVHAGSTASSVTYTTPYSAGGIGIFSNAASVRVTDLSVTKLPDCAVTIQSTSGGTTAGAGTYSYGETVTVTATPDSGYYFGGWVRGETVVSNQESYSFEVTDDTAIYARFLEFPIRYNGMDSASRAAVVKLENVEGATRVGMEITVATADGENAYTVSTDYVNPAANGKKAWIALEDKVYYCDISGDGTADSTDMAALKAGLLADRALGTTADLNEDSQVDILDLACFKTALAQPEMQFEEGLITDYSYPFLFADKLEEAEIQYVKLLPFSENGGNKTYALPQYLSYEEKNITVNSNSDHHTPFGKLRIACVGDSLTKGIGATGWNQGDYSEAYPPQLGALLGDAYEVGNFGIGSSYVYYYEGRTASLWYPNTAEYAASNVFDADIIIILLGCNDIRVVDNETKAEAWKAQFTELVEHYQAFENDPVIYISSNQALELYDEANVAKGTANYTLRDPAYRQYILPRQEQVANELGCTFIDMYHDLYEEFMTEKYFASDMIHPNSAGYQMMAEYMYAQIAPILEGFWYR